MATIDEQPINHGAVSDEFHEVFDLDLVSGRWFSEEDAVLDWEPLVMTQPLSEALFGREDPIGQQVEWKRGKDEARVVGVVSDYRRRGEFSEPSFFVLTRVEDDAHVRFLVKVRPGTPLAAQEQIDKRLKAMASGYRVSITTLEEDRASSFKLSLIPLFSRWGRLSVGVGHGGALVERRAVAADDAEIPGDRPEKGLGRVRGQYLRAVDGRDAGGRQHRRNRWPTGHHAIPTTGIAQLHQRNLRAQSGLCSAGNLRPRDRVQPVSGAASLPDTAGRGAAPRMSRNEAVRSSNKPKRTLYIPEENVMKSIKSAITPIATVATAFSCGVAGAENITVQMESVREDSVEHLFQPMLIRFPIGAELTEGLPDIQSVAGLEINEPLHARLSFLDSPAEPIVVLGLDNDGRDIAFAVADSTAEPQRLQLTESFSKLIESEALQAELTVPPAGQAPEFTLELVLSREQNIIPCCIATSNCG